MTYFRTIWAVLWATGGVLLVLALTKPEWDGDFQSAVGVVIMLFTGGFLGAGFGLFLLYLVTGRRFRK